MIAMLRPSMGRTLLTIDQPSGTKGQARKYSKSAFKFTRVVLCMDLKWTERNGEIQQPIGWLEGVRLPRVTGGTKVIRTQ
jgi:hypothetical protein